VVRSLGTWIGIVLISGSIGCLLYTNPVNDAPMILSITLPTNLVRNAPLDFTAKVKDDQSTPLGYVWGITSGDCPDGNALPPAAATNPPAGTSAVLQGQMLSAIGPYCVFVTVTDEHGATDHRTASFQIVDQPPMPSITPINNTIDRTEVALAALTPLYSDLCFTASTSSDPDGDPLKFCWMLTAPSQPPVSLGGCPDAPGDICFNVAVKGTYTLAVTADDGHGMTKDFTLTFAVDQDEPPCIVATNPAFLRGTIVGDPAMLLPFNVGEVDDDGDPYPPPPPPTSKGVSTFAWSWRIGLTGVFTRDVLNTSPRFEIPAGSYRSGQEVQVRVEARDRQMQLCDPSGGMTDAMFCPPPPSTCHQWVTWTVEFR
jgi:hypothetical protein